MKPSSPHNKAKDTSTSPASSSQGWLVPLVLFTFAGLASLIVYIYRKITRRPVQAPAGDSAQVAQKPVAPVAIELPITTALPPTVPAASLVTAHTEAPTEKANDLPFVQFSWPEENPFRLWWATASNWPIFETISRQLKTHSHLLVGPFLALLLAFMAQGFYDYHSIPGYGIILNRAWLTAAPETTRILQGTLIYILSMLIWFFTAPVLEMDGGRTGMVGLITSSSGRYPVYRFFLLLASICVYITSIVLFIYSGENSFIQGLWVAGLILFILSQAPAPGSSSPGADESPAFNWRHWLVLGLILAVAFWLRFYHLDTLPDDFHGDMGSIGLQARDFLSGVNKSIFSNWSFTGYPLMAFLPIVFTMSVFGNTLFGMQMAAVLTGVFSILAIYLLVWRIFNSHRMATLTSILVAINITHIHFTRIVNNDPMPFCYFSLFFLVDGLKSRRSLSFALAGIFLGLSQQMYASGRVFLFITVAFLLYALIFQRQWFTNNKRRLLLVGFGMMLAMGPSLFYNSLHWSEYVERARQVFLFDPGVMDHLMGKYQAHSAFEVILNQVRLSLLMFNYSGDSSTQFGFAYPMFNSLVSPLILLGLAFALRRWKEPGVILTLAWLGLMAFFGGIMTVDAPAWPRLVGIVPAAAILIALVFEQLIALGNRLESPRLAQVITACIVAGLFIVGWLNWNIYVASTSDNASAPAYTGRYIARLPENVTACGLITGPALTVRETYFLAWPHHLVDIPTNGEDQDLDNCTGYPVAWVFTPENTGRLPAVMTRWPGGTIQKHTFANGYELTFYVAGVIPPTPSTPGSPVPWSGIYYALYLVSVVTLTGIFTWRFLKRSAQRNLSAKTTATPRSFLSQLPTIQVNWITLQNAYRGGLSAMKTGGLDSITEFYGWYDRLTSFDFPAMNPGQVIKLVLSFLLPFLALGLAFFGQTFFDQPKNEGIHLPVQWFLGLTDDQRLAAGSALLLFASLIWLFVTVFGKKEQAGPPKPLGAIRSEAASTYPAGRNLRFAGLTCTILSILIYFFIGENGLVITLWAAGILLFLFSIFTWGKYSAGRAEDSPVFRWYHTAALALMLVLAFSLRVYNLYNIPQDLSTDMARFGIGLRENLAGIGGIFGGSTFSNLPYMFSLAFVRNNLFGLYFPAVVMGTLNILGVYFFTWRFFDNHRLAFLTAAILTIHPAHIEFSKITFFIDPWFYGFFALFFLVDGLKGRRSGSFALSGMLTGCALVSYASGRAMIPLIFLLLAGVFLFRRKWITDNLPNFIWMGLGIVIALGPSLVYMIANWSEYMQRASEVLIFNPGNVDHLKATYQVNSINQIIWEQVKRTLLTFNYYTDRSAQFGYPFAMFNAMVSPLLALGLGMSIYRWRRPANLFLVAAFGFILVTGGILTDDAPTWVRIVGVLPLAALLIALVLDEFLQLFDRSLLMVFSPFIFALVLIYLAVMGLTDWKYYTAIVGIQPRPVVNVARYLDSLPPEINACGITEGFGMDQEEVKFMGWPRVLVPVPPDIPAITPDLCPGPDLVWVLTPSYRHRLPEIKAIWPGGTVQDHLYTNGGVMFTTYTFIGK